MSLALNNSDGMSSSLMEAATAGSLPVHSRGSCGRETLPAGRGAIFVSATDPEDVAATVTRGLTDDDLVDTAREINETASAEYFDRDRIRARVLDMYERIYDHTYMEQSMSFPALTLIVCQATPNFSDRRSSRSVPRLMGRQPSPALPARPHRGAGCRSRNTGCGLQFDPR